MSTPESPDDSTKIIKENTSSLLDQIIQTSHQSSIPTDSPDTNSATNPNSSN